MFAVKGIFDISNPFTGREDPFVALGACGLPPGDLMTTLRAAMLKADGHPSEEFDHLITVVPANDNEEDKG